MQTFLCSFFSSEGEGEIKQYYHLKCLFETFAKAKATTKVIETVDEIEGFQQLEEADKKEIIDILKSKPDRPKVEPKSKTTKNEDVDQKKPKKRVSNDSENDEKTLPTKKIKESDDKKNNSKDDKFETFQIICKKLADESGHLKKSAILKDFLKDGIEKNGYKGNTYLFMKLLIPSASKRVYNLNSKQLIKLFSKIFDTDHDDMMDHLNKGKHHLIVKLYWIKLIIKQLIGDVSDTIRHYFSKSNTFKPKTESTLSLDDIDSYLDKLTHVTKENDQLKLLEEIAKKCTKNDLMMLIRLIKKDIKIEAGASILLDAINPKAYAAYQVSNDLKDVIERSSQESKTGLKKDLSVRVNLMTVNNLK